MCFMFAFIFVAAMSKSAYEQIISYLDTYKGSRNSTIYDLTKIFLLYWIYMISAGFYNKRKTMYVIADVGLHMFFLYIFICHFVNPF